jgi:hypothetical protein
MPEIYCRSLRADWESSTLVKDAGSRSDTPLYGLSVYDWYMQANIFSAKREAVDPRGWVTELRAALAIGAPKDRPGVLFAPSRVPAWSMPLIEFQ